MDYEYSMPMSFGVLGAAGTAQSFTIASPWNAPTEMALLHLSCQDAGTLIIAPTPVQAPTAATTATPSGAMPGWYLSPHGAALYTLPAVFAPMPSTLYGSWATAGAYAAVVTAVFRRRVPQVATDA